MISPRSTKTENQYQNFKKAKKDAGQDLTVFDLKDEIIIREFTYWLIIENRFPYDNMTSVNHMLIPKRTINDLSEASDIELNEHQDIRKILIEDAFYDAIVENLPRSKSVKQHAHLHLVRWKYTNDDGKNKSDSNL
jgi:diadenosine tetraphosphate (Ap4A) HIT family hydrolase